MSIPRQIVIGLVMGGPPWGALALVDVRLGQVGLVVQFVGLALVIGALIRVYRGHF